MFRITATLTRPLPSLELMYPVRAEVKATARMTAYHLNASGASVIAINGKSPPAAAEKREENAASHGFR